MERTSVQTTRSLKENVSQAIDRRQSDLLRLGADLWKTPELGYREFETAGRFCQELDRLGLQYRSGLAITGVKAILDTGRPGPTIAVMGELDALAVFDHPEANPKTGAVHACGHNAQLTAVIGVAMGLIESGALEKLSGKIAIMAVPAEEYVEIEYRIGLREAGKIEFLGGKPELIKLGELDDVQLAMMTHLTSSPEDRVCGIAESSNGCIAKQMRFIGKASHAGGSPHQGINALAAANIALAAINAQRETFRDEDSIRVHPIITKGGDVVNVIPADVRMETFVRGKTVDAIEAADKKVDRALRAGAMALGASVRIVTLPGYLPQVNDRELTAIYRQNAEARYGAGSFAQGGHRGGSTDMGDVEHILPAIHPFHSGASGSAHGKDYQITNPRLAYLGSAKLMAETVVDLLADDAREARRIVAGAKPKMTKDEYLSFLRRTFRDELYQG